MLSARTSSGRIHAVVRHPRVVQGLEAMTLRTDHSFSRHAHDGFGVGVITAGAQRSWSGVGWVEAGPGDVITVNPGEMHDGAPVGGPRAWRMLYLDPALVARALADEGEDRPEITRPVLRDPALAALFGRLFMRSTAAATDLLALEQDLLRMLVHLLRRYGAQPHHLSAAVPGVAVARRRLDQSPEQPATLSELAALSGVSRFQLVRGFARQVGVTPHAYLVQRRVQLVRRLLATGLSPAEAAHKAGFADQSHMTRAFRRQLGVTPARYREAVR